MIRCAVAAEHPEGDVLVAAPLELPGGTNAGAVAVEQDRQQHPWLVGRSAVPVSPIGGQERTKVELVDDLQDEPGQMVGR
jgi:hypothetical protein